MALNTNSIALIISAVALIGTTLQALQQHAATSDGYRRCAEAVVGPWHKRTRRRFRWRELRFETLYAAPSIGYRMARLDRVLPFCDDIDLIRSDVSPVGAYGERAGWVSLVECLGAHYVVVDHFSRGKLGENRCYMVPRMEIPSRSWDFVPPDIIKPLALCQVGSLVQLVRRLGLTWIEFDPKSGIYRAEGNHQNITSLGVSGQGTV